MIWQGLLVSVRDAAEAAAAVAGGASIIDVKEPGNGPLGRPGPAAIAAVVAAVAGRRPWTLAGGELVDLTRAGASTAWCGAADGPPAAIKLGLAHAVDTDWKDRLAAAFAGVPRGTRTVAVAYADWQRARSPAPDAVVAAAARLGCVGLLVDTFDKSAAGLLDGHSGQPAAWVRAAREAGLRVAVAGRITLEQIGAAWDLGPDVVALRSAVCSNGRFGKVEEDLVRRAVKRCPSSAVDQAVPPT